MAHICINEKELGAIQSNLSKLDKEIFGNGSDGLAKTVPVLTEKIGELCKTISALQTAVSGLTKFEEEELTRRATQKDIEEKNNKSYCKNLKTISTVIAFLGMAGVMFFGFKNMAKQNKETRTYIENVMEPVVVRGSHYDPFAKDTTE